MKSIFVLLLLLSFSCANQEQLKALENELNTLKTKQAAYDNLAENNKATVLAFFKSVEDENAKAIAALFAEDGIHVNPYHSGIFPTGAIGREAILAYWTPVFPNFDGMSFPIEQIFAMEDPNRVYVEFRGDIKLKNEAGIYTNNYYSTFKFNTDGKITEFVEIFNPITAAKAFGFTDQIK